MTLEELISELYKLPKDKVIKKGFANPHSWRGSYRELAFEPFGPVTIMSMINDANNACGATYTGYKGGEFYMSEDSNVYIDCYGGCNDDGTAIDKVIADIKESIK